MNPDLFGAVRHRRARWTGSRELVLVGHDHCPSCGAVPDGLTVHEDALLRHGGHGATRITTTLHCPCGWSLTVQQHETRPPR